MLHARERVVSNTLLGDQRVRGRRDRIGLDSAVVAATLSREVGRRERTPDCWRTWRLLPRLRLAARLGDPGSECDQVLIPDRSDAGVDCLSFVRQTSTREGADQLGAQTEPNHVGATEVEVEISPGPRKGSRSLETLEFQASLEADKEKSVRAIERSGTFRKSSASTTTSTAKGRSCRQRTAT